MESMFQRIADAASREYGSATSARLGNAAVGVKEIRACETTKGASQSPQRDECSPNQKSRQGDDGLD